MRDIHEFYSKASSVVSSFNAFAKSHGLVGIAIADHICYKCSSSDSFEAKRRLFENPGWIYQAMIAGRRIATINLLKPIETNLGNIYTLELSDQKPNGSQTEGFDHIEVYATGEQDYNGLVSHLQSKGLEVKKIERPHHTTHDVDIGNGFLLRLTQGPLIAKITEEMTS